MNYESIFILPPSIHSLEERIRNRDEDLTAIDLRLKNAKDELAHGEYKHLIVNDSFNKAADNYSILLLKMSLQQITTKKCTKLIIVLLGK